MTHPLLELAERRTVLLDGAMGTMLMARGLAVGMAPEIWNVERPDLVREVHAAYFAAGADVVSTNSFGGTPLKLAAHGLEGRAYELNHAAARLAREAAPPGRFVAGSVGPTGKFLRPHGPCSEQDLEAAFADQVRGLAAGGVDLVLIETQYDLREALAAVRGARSVASLPIFVTMTFNDTPRGFFTLMGDTPARAAGELERAGAAAFGANCTLAADRMAACVRACRGAIGLPLVAQANAGRPVAGEDGRVTYSQTLEDYVRHVPDIVRAGASFVGGCCGTDPSFIRAMAGIVGKEAP
ncbi:MAG TPA: homocysteine S-methyltransferase family protein [Candidatus Aminicenantes bacterium]|nr:homocysteine S-methyltransferase family protein [Candidatus Aminicenantes bacterium]